MSISALCTAHPVGAVASRPGARTPMFGAKYGANTSAFAARVGSGSRAGQRGALVIQMAASKEKKDRDLSMLKGMLENEDTLLVAGFRYQGLSVSRSWHDKALRPGILDRTRKSECSTPLHLSAPDGLRA